MGAFMKSKSCTTMGSKVSPYPILKSTFSEKIIDDQRKFNFSEGLYMPQEIEASKGTLTIHIIYNIFDIFGHVLLT